MADDTVQIIKNARVDATSLSEFMYYPATVTVNRRLAPPIHTLEYYLQYLEGLEKVYTQQTGVVNVNGVQVKAITQAVIDALNSAAIDNNTQVDTLITATPQGVGMVARTQAQVNAETVSLLDFGAPYSTDSTTHLQKAIDYLSANGGGVLDIPYHTGTLVISGLVVLKANIVINCAKNLIVDCRGYAGTKQFVLLGTTDAERVLTVNKTTGDTSIKTSPNHGYKVGDDVLIVSQRECAHADAGKLWQLGETTANVTSPFFAEPLVVESIANYSTFVSTSALIFPDYNINNSSETSPTARTASTVMRVNYAKSLEWHGGKFLKNTGSLFDLTWTKDCVISIDVQRGYGTGQEVTNTFGLNNKIAVKVTRPANWVLEADHSSYNSVKDVSSWYTTVLLDEENGSQGLDQTYTLYCGILPTYKVRHINSHEDAMTTHGCVYGGDINVYAVNPKKAGIRNRARFVKVNIFASNAYWGMYNSSWGVLDCQFDVHLVNCTRNGVVFLSTGVTSTAPAGKNVRLSGIIYISPKSTSAAIDIRDNEDTASYYSDCKISLVNLNIRSYDRAIKAGMGMNGITLDNVNIEHYGTQPPIWFMGSAGHKIGSLDVDIKVGDARNNYAIYGEVLTTDATLYKQYGAHAYAIDYKSCKVTNGQLMNNDIRLIANKMEFNGDSSGNDGQYLKNSNSVPLTIIDLKTGIIGQNRLIIDKTVPIGMVLRFYLTSADVNTVLGLYVTDIDVQNLVFFDGVNDLGGRNISASTAKYFNIQRVSETVINVYK